MITETIAAPRPIKKYKTANIKERKSKKDMIITSMNNYNMQNFYTEEGQN